MFKSVLRGKEETIIVRIPDEEEIKNCACTRCVHKNVCSMKELHNKEVAMIMQAISDAYKKSDFDQRRSTVYLYCNEYLSEEEFS